MFQSNYYRTPLDSCFEETSLAYYMMLIVHFSKVLALWLLYINLIGQTRSQEILSAGEVCENSGKIIECFEIITCKLYVNITCKHYIVLFPKITIKGK